MAENHYQAAIEDCTAAIKLDPNDVSFYLDRGTFQSEIGTLKTDQGNTAEAQMFYEAAIETYTQVIKLNPKEATAYNNRAWVKHLLAESKIAAETTDVAQDLYKSAIIDSNESIRLDTQVAAFYHTRGVVKAAMGDTIGAIEDYDITLKYNPKHIKTYLDRGHAKEILGQQDAAKADFDKVKELDPTMFKKSSGIPRTPK